MRKLWLSILALCLISPGAIASGPHSPNDSLKFNLWRLDSGSKINTRGAVTVAAPTGVSFTDTENIKTAIMSGKKTVNFPAGKYVVETYHYPANNQACIIPLSGQTFVMADGTTICANPTAMTGTANAVMFDITSKSNVTIYSLGKAYLTMNRQDFAVGVDQFHHIFQIQSSSGVTLRNLWCGYSGGDGFFTGSNGGAAAPTTQLTITSCTAYACYRNGLTLDNNIGANITGCYFLNQQGSSLCTGIDMEADWVNSHFVNINVTNCDMEGNTTFALCVHTAVLNASDPTSSTITAVFQSCTMSAYASFGDTGLYTIGPIGGGPVGSIIWNDCIVNSCTGRGFQIASHGSTLTAFTFNRCWFGNYCLNKVVQLNLINEDAGAPLTGLWYGGVTFNNCTWVEYTRGGTNYQVEGFKSVCLGASDLHGSGNTFIGNAAWGWNFPNRIPTTFDITATPSITFSP